MRAKQPSKIDENALGNPLGDGISNHFQNDCPWINERLQNGRGRYELNKTISVLERGLFFVYRALRAESKYAYRGDRGKDSKNGQDGKEDIACIERENYGDGKGGVLICKRSLLAPS